MSASGMLPPGEVVPDGDWSARAVIDPNTQVRVQMSANLAITGGAVAYLLNPPESVRVSPHSRSA